IRQEQGQKYYNRVKGGKAAADKREKQKSLSISPADLEHYSSSYLISQSKEDLKRLMDACVRANAKADPRAVEIGVLYTLLQRNGSTEPIRSVQYFAPEISKMAKQIKGMGDKAIDALLERRRQQV